MGGPGAARTAGTGSAVECALSCAISGLGRAFGPNLRVFTEQQHREMKFMWKARILVEVKSHGQGQRRGAHLRQRNAGAAADTQAQVCVSLPTQRDEDRTSIPALVKTG